MIATGSSPAMPPIPGLDEMPYLTNETIFDLKRCPEHLIIIGAGPIGLELAQAHRRLGAEVTVLEAATPLAKDDPECAAIVLDQLAREGVVDPRGRRGGARRSERDGRSQVVIGGRRARRRSTAAHLLVATGRRANIDGARSRSRRHRVRRRAASRSTRGCAPRTSRVYAIGDVAGGCSSPMPPTITPAS